MKKLNFFIYGILLIILSACSSTSADTFPAVELPFTIADETYESDFFEDILVEESELEDKQVLYKATLRELTNEEAERFVERKASQTTNLLKENYKAVEFDFETVEVLSRGKSFGRFNEDTTNFVFDETIIPEKFYQILDYSDKNSILGIRKRDNEDIIYSTIYENMKIISIIRNDYAKNGLQLKTTINDKEIYINIENQL